MPDMTEAYGSPRIGPQIASLSGDVVKASPPEQNREALSVSF